MDISARCRAELTELLYRELRAAYAAQLAKGADQDELLADMDRRAETLRRMTPKGK